MNYVWMWTAGLLIIAAIVVVYERQNADLESWADALSEENADLHRQVATLRGSSWSS